MHDYWTYFSRTNDCSVKMIQVVSLAGETFVQVFYFFFFKQKTAYEMQRGLVGSEMCIRDRNMWEVMAFFRKTILIALPPTGEAPHVPVSYTHLTLPTILLVQISVVAVSLKKKNEQEKPRRRQQELSGEHKTV
eukprot:TRINITY_DN22549_c0_g1_i4.p2 TRINITY_DN22549_c0_g1~~TRINITY_DN22549_c0_g1_i4.p2  ORF type:complete len:134 (+),score=34.66 TRINITY_DN22549_c0_g1_i4:33-434(+)